VFPVALLLFAFALILGGCGGERTFEPDEFVDEANAEGASVDLGGALTSIEEGVDVYQLSFAGEGAGTPSAGEAVSGGSLVHTENADAAREEFERCESAATLTCYRAANVVLYFDAEPSDERVARVDAAVRALGSE
jgi:hypothetical protein